MRKTLAVFVMALAILAALHPAVAQRAGKVYRIGFLTTASPSKTFKARLAAFRQGLQELGYVEGENILIDERYAEGQRENLPKLAQELVRLEPDIIVTHGGRVAQTADRAARAVDRTIPVVFAVDADPIGNGTVASLARPGGNITGLSESHSDLVAKRLELLKEVVPSATRVAVFWNPNARHTQSQLKVLQAVAHALSLTLLPLKVDSADDVRRAFETIRRERARVLNVLGYSRTIARRGRIVSSTREIGLATIFTSERWPVSGGLMSYGVNFLDMYRRAATFVDKILKGAKPAELPVEQPTRFYPTVNLKTAKALGITLPRSILLRAEKVIE